jgi:hypothetical protein
MRITDAQRASIVGRLIAYALVAGLVVLVFAQ